MDYKKSGVDVEAGDQLVDWLKIDAKPKGPQAGRVVGGIGGFAALFRCQFPEMKKPVLVSSTDGVGTKLKLAFHFQEYEGIGQDLVAMCVNDVATTGGVPLFFLDYYATGKLDLVQAKEFLKGVRKACEKTGCILLGGETAEMPSIYHPGEFDCAGFSVGVVDEDQILGAHLVSEGDICVGVSSSGFHSNGYSLLRQVFKDDLDKWKKELLAPTHLYSELAQKIKGISNAFAHITGGGVENIPRVVPEHLGVKLN